MLDVVSKHNKQQDFPLLSRDCASKNYNFNYQGLNFSQNSFHIFAGLNALYELDKLETCFNTLRLNNLSCTRIGFFKPRTSPYSFQGVGSKMLLPAFKLAEDYGIKVIALEITEASQIDHVYRALAQTTKLGVMLQVGTRNSQNFELLKQLGRQKDHPILYKRGYGISLKESLNAAEYLSLEGNKKIIFCLRGVKNICTFPHRNQVDFALISAIHRLTKMPVCADPSHALGNLETCHNKIQDIMHISAQAVIAGANMLLVDIHPADSAAIVDAKQALALNRLNLFLEDMKLCRNSYLQRLKLHNPKNGSCE